jgi:hypothetical protein
MLMTVIMRVTPRARSNDAAHYDGRMSNQLSGASSASGADAAAPQSILLREARREDVPAIVALLADDTLGAGREGPLDDAYWAAWEQIAADPRSRLLVAETAGRVVGTLRAVPDQPVTMTSCAARARPSRATLAGLS